MSLAYINNGDTGYDARQAINSTIGAVNELSITNWSSTGTTFTTSGTTQSLWEWAIESPSTQTGYNAMTIKASIVGYSPSDSKAYGAELFATFYSQAGYNAVQVGTTDVVEKTNFSTATSHIAVSDSGTIILSIIGEEGKTIYWTGEFRTIMTAYVD